jgi:hypothetical protein
VLPDFLSLAALAAGPVVAGEQGGRLVAKVAVSWEVPERGALQLVLWDGSGVAVPALVELPAQQAIVREAARDPREGWLAVLRADVVPSRFFADGRLELRLHAAVWVARSHEDVLRRLEHFGAFGPAGAVVPASVLHGSVFNRKWRCCACQCTTLLPKLSCILCEQTFWPELDAVE